jgi:hypothetical protein
MLFSVEEESAGGKIFGGSMMPVVVELSRGSLIGVVVWAYADARGEKSIERTTRKVVSLYTNGTVL